MLASATLTLGRSRSSLSLEFNSCSLRSLRSAIDCFFDFVSPPSRIAYAAGILLLLRSRDSESGHSSPHASSLERFAIKSKESRSRHDWPWWEIGKDLRVVELVLENRVPEFGRLFGLRMNVERDL